MTWADVTKEPKPNVVRQFGWVCLVLFGAIGLLQVLHKGRPALGWSLVAFAVLCLVLSLTVPRIFRWFFTGAMLVAFPIGFVVSQVMLAILFFGVFLVLGLLLRARRWDAMLRRRKPPGASDWEAKPMPTEVRRYLRQY